MPYEKLYQDELQNRRLNDRRIEALEVNLAIVTTKITDIASDMAELKSDVKALVGFKSFIVGGAAAISAIVSLGMELLRRIAPGHSVP